MANTRSASHKPSAVAGATQLNAPAPPGIADVKGSVLSTASGPTRPPADSDQPDEAAPDAQRRLAKQRSGVQQAALEMPANALKASEYGFENGLQPSQGQHIADSPDDVVGASTVSESIESDKLGGGIPHPGHNPLNGPLDRVRVDSQQRALTTNQGVQVADNQNSLKAGLRGPTLLEDFILREKITHFDHERIPERVVHARGSGAHGYFETYDSLADITRAGLFDKAGKRTPVFVRFSTVAGERGSADTVRDTRGFAVKFYTDEGNWDLVGNNIPVFFIQDAMKFPDLIHAVKPEPNTGIPQASSAHDTFWDFISLMPESMHHTLWVMSDHGIPRSYRTMRGFGVHSFRLVNAAGDACFVKFHWLPVAGTHSLVWDEAAKIAGADPDFHRRDLWEAIESGNSPEYELALQVFTEAQAEAFGFDVLDATKLVPEEQVPLRVVGRMVLDRNPDNFFAETEQVAFCTAHVVPGIDFSNDPLLQGRIHSYLDTQITRLGGANFHEIPINAPVAQVHNNQRDGIHRQALHRGRVSYEPNSLGGGCPYQAGRVGFVTASADASTLEQPYQDKVRGKPERFADHYSQAQLFWRSQSPAEKRHIIAAFRFELSRVTVVAVRQRVVSQLINVDAALAQGVADGLGMETLPDAQPIVRAGPVEGDVDVSQSLSLVARPGNGGAAGRRVALLVAEGVDGGSLRQVQQRLLQARAVPRFVGAQLGRVSVSGGGSAIEVETTLEASPSVLWDAMVLPGGEWTPDRAARGSIGEFVAAQYRHCKPILALGERSRDVLGALGVTTDATDGTPEPGVMLATSFSDAGLSGPLDAFVFALGQHREYDRELTGGWG
jgi:catalase